MEQNIFSGIMQDNLSGSGTILTRVQQQLSALSGKENRNVSSLLAQLSALENRFPHFALLFHFLNDFRHFLARKKNVSGNEIAAFVGQYRKQWENTQQKAAENLLGQLSLAGKNILLHSNSSSLYVLLQEMKRRGIFPVIWQTVSSPANEGLLQAKTAAKLGFEVHVIHEDAVGKFMDRLDILLLGADLLWEKAFVNKTGSLPLTLIYRYFGKPVYVLAEKRKQISRENVKAERFRQFLEENPGPPEEIFPRPGKNIKVYNYYFETIPLTLATRIFTEA